MSNVLVIDPHSYLSSENVKRLADRVMETHDLDPSEVFRIELSEADAVVWRWPWSFTDGKKRGVVYWDGEQPALLAVRRRYPHPTHRSNAA